MIEVIPMDNYLFVKVRVNFSTSGGIILPEITDKHTSIADVIAAGPGCSDPGDGKSPIYIGNTIFFNKYSGIHIDFMEEEFKLVRREDVYAVLKESIII